MGDKYRDLKDVKESIYRDMRKTGYSDSAAKSKVNAVIDRVDRTQNKRNGN